jgi:hypothetical protein
MAFFVSLRRHLRNRAIAASPLLASVPPELHSGVGKRVCVSREKRFCYFRVPKAANSTVTNSLAAAIYGQRGLDDSANVAKASFRDITEIATLTEEELLAGYFCFTIVRHPLSRVLSAYLDKVQRHDATQVVNGDIPGGVTFDYFLDYLADGGIFKNIHWAPQDSIVPIHPDKLHFVGRVENLDDDFAGLSTAIFGEVKPLMNRQSGRTGAAAKVAAVYTARQRALVERLYAEDIRRFYDAASG